MKILPYIFLLAIFPLVFVIASPTQEPQKSELIVISGYLLRVTGDNVNVIWIHPKEKPWPGIKVAPVIDTSR